MIEKPKSLNIEWKIIIKDTKFELTIDSHSFYLKPYIPPMVNEWTQKVSLLAINDTKNGFYT
jgi:hypothetical protein